MNFNGEDKERKNYQSHSFGVIVIMSALIVMGLIMIYSTSSPQSGLQYLVSQMVYIGVGVAFLLIIWKLIDYSKLEKYGKIFLIITWVALGYLVLSRFLIEAKMVSSMPLVYSIKGAYRWIKLPLFNIQPSEFAKLALIIYLSAYYQKYHFFKRKIRDGVVYPTIVVAITCVLILAGKNMSVTIVCGFIGMSIVFVSGIRCKYLVVLGFIAGLVLTFAVIDYKYDLKILFPEYRRDRLHSWFKPEDDPLGKGMQLWRSQIALGSGGITGRGYTQSIMKYQYLPEAHTDFILATTGEELGFVALIFILLLYQGLVIFGLRISYNSVDYFGAYLSIGISMSIFMHCMVNFSVMSGVLPTTGLTAPFMSYGGSSMLANLLGIGLLLSIDNKILKKEDDLDEDFG